MMKSNHFIYEFYHALICPFSSCSSEISANVESLKTCSAES